MRKRLINIFSFLVTLIFFCYICSIGIKNIFRYNKFKLEYSDLTTEYLKELHLNEVYNKQLSSLNNDFYWEALAKKQLNYIKKDEVVYKVISN
ncbi:MAG: septum formation initiator family protein [bacterium]|nr:septum formation initiator family protein [bacterium]